MLDLFVFDGHILFDESVTTSPDYGDNFFFLILWFSFVFFLFNGFFEEGLFGHSAGEVFDVGIQCEVELVFEVFGLGFEELKMMFFVLFLILVDKFIVLFFPEFMVLFGLCFG